jgi:hypothetical protein
MPSEFDSQLKELCTLLENTYGIKPRPVYEANDRIQAFGFNISGGGGLRMEPGRRYTLGEIANAPNYDQEAEDIFSGHMQRLGLTATIERQRDGELWVRLPGGIDGSDTMSLFSWVAGLQEIAQNKIPEGRNLQEYNAAFLSGAGIENAGYGHVTLASLDSRRLIIDLRREALRYLRTEQIAWGPEKIPDAFIEDMGKFFAEAAAPDTRRSIDSMNLREAYETATRRHGMNPQAEPLLLNPMNTMLSKYIGRQAGNSRDDL